MSSEYPKIAAALTYMFDAWIVGSAADPLNKDFRDYDVLVLFSRWNEAAQLIPSNAVPNSFGGWKVANQPTPTGTIVEVDIWPGELGTLMQNAKAKFAYHPRSNTRLVVNRKEETNDNTA